MDDSIVIKPTWEKLENSCPDDLIVEIDPGTAFGTDILFPFSKYEGANGLSGHFLLLFQPHLHQYRYRPELKKQQKPGTEPGREFLEWSEKKSLPRVKAQRRGFAELKF